MPTALIQQWDAPLDPSDVKDYVSDFTPEMTATGDVIINSVFQLSAAAQADGVQIHNQTFTATSGIVFLKVDPGFQNLPDWDGEGKVHELTHTIDTQGGRKLSKTLRFLVQQQ